MSTSTSSLAGAATSAQPLHIADWVSQLNALKPAAAVQQALQQPDERLIALLENPDLRHEQALFARVVRDARQAVLDGIPEDRLADLLSNLPKEALAAALQLLSPEVRASVQGLMAYPEGTAGSMMTTELVQVPSGWTVGQALTHIRQVQRTRETVYAIYVVDEQSRVLQFVLSLRQLVCAQEGEALSALWDGSPPIVVDALMDREEAARMIRRHDFLALPVVDGQQRVLGIVTVDDVIDALMDEAAEDMGRFGGGEHIGKPYLQAGFATMLQKRGGWLAILFLGEMLTASAMQYYEMQLEKAVVLAMFIPLIMSSGGNSGSQATSLLIRGLALGEVRLGDWWRVMLRELPTGLVLGTGLGFLGFLRIWVWQHLGLYDYGPYYLLVGMTIWASLIGVVCFGSSVGSMLPFVLQRLGLDPASASAPLVATLVDVLGLVIYFSVAAMILTGSLL